MDFDDDEGIDGRMTRIKWCGWGLGAVEEEEWKGYRY